MRFLLLSLLAFWSTQAISKDYSFYHHKSSLKKIANEQDQQTFKHIFTQKHKPAALFCKKNSKQKVKKDKNKKRLKRVLKKMKRAIFHSKWGKKIFSSPYELVELENENPDLLEIKLNPKKKRRAKSKYTPVEVIYKLVKKGESKRKARRHKLDISNFKFAIDLANQDVGDYELYLTLVSYKTSHLKRRFKFKYFHFAKLEISKELSDAVITPKLALIEKRHNDSWLVFDLAESSVTHGQLDKFIVRVLKDEVEIEQKEFSFSETSQFEYIFTQAASYQFEVEVFNSLGGSQKVLSQIFDVQHFAPTVGYSLEAKAGYPDIYKINFDQTTLPTSANGFSFFAARVYQEGILVDEKVTNTKEFEFQIKARGEFELQLYVGADNGTLNYVSDPNVYFIDESVPQSLFLNYSHHFFDEIDPRKLYVAFKNEITQQQFKQFNVSLKHLASGQTQNYVSDIYIYDQMILHALVGSYEPGEYEFTLELELNDGTKSAPFVITENFDFDLGQVALDIEVTPVSGKARTYLFDASASTPGNYGEFSLLGCEFRHEANNFSTQYSLKEGPLELKVPFAGTWQMNCLGETSLGLSASYSQTFVVDNIKPVASFEISPLDENLRTVQFRASSFDADGTVVGGLLQMTTPLGAYYEYHVGEELTLNLTKPGTYIFSYSVQDNDGEWSQVVIKEYEVFNQAPTIQLSSNEVNEYRREFSLMWLAQDNDSSVVTTKLKATSETGDVLTLNTDQNPVIFRLSSPGKWIVSGEVIDEDGAAASSQVEITAKNHAPVSNITVEDDNPKQFEVIELSAQGSSDPNGDPISYVWEFEDGTKKTDSVIYHHFVEIGEHKVKLQVIDIFGMSTTSEYIVHVEQADYAAPVAKMNIGGKFNEQTNELQGKLYADIGMTDSSEGEIISYDWSISDGTTYTGKRIYGHEFKMAGSYTVSLTVKTEFAQVDTVTKEIHVTNPVDPQDIASAYELIITGINRIGFNSKNVHLVLDVPLAQNIPQIPSISINESGVVNGLTRISKKRFEADIVLDEGYNDIEIELYDENNNFIRKSLTIKAGSVNKVLALKTDSESLLTNRNLILSYVEDNAPVQIELVSDENGLIHFENLPQLKGSLTLIDPNYEYTYFGEIDMLDEVLIAKEIAESQISNNDFSQGVLGWDLEANKKEVLNDGQNNYLNLEFLSDRGGRVKRVFSHQGDEKFIQTKIKLSSLLAGQRAKVQLINTKTGQIWEKLIKGETHDSFEEITPVVKANDGDKVKLDIEIFKEEQSTGFLERTFGIKKAHAQTVILMNVLPLETKAFLVNIKLLDLNNVSSSLSSLYNLTPLTHLSLGDYEEGSNAIYAEASFESLGQYDGEIRLDSIEIVQDETTLPITSVGENFQGILSFYGVPYKKGYVSSYLDSQKLTNTTQGELADFSPLFLIPSNADTFNAEDRILIKVGFSIRSRFNNQVVETQEFKEFSFRPNKLLFNRNVPESRFYLGSDLSDYDNPHYGDYWASPYTVKALVDLLANKKLNFIIGDISNINGHRPNIEGVTKTFFGAHSWHNDGYRFDAVTTNFGGGSDGLDFASFIDLREMVLNPKIVKHLQKVRVSIPEGFSGRKIRGMCLKGRSILKLTNLSTSSYGISRDTSRDHSTHWHLKLKTGNGASYFSYANNPIESQVEELVDKDDQGRTIRTFKLIDNSHLMYFNLYRVSGQNKIESLFDNDLNSETKILTNLPDRLGGRNAWAKIESFVGSEVKITYSLGVNLAGLSEYKIYVGYNNPVIEADSKELYSCTSSDYTLIPNEVTDCNQDGVHNDRARITEFGGYIGEHVEITNTANVVNGARVCGNAKIQTENFGFTGSDIVVESGTVIGDYCSYVSLVGGFFIPVEKNDYSRFKNTELCTTPVANSNSLFYFENKGEDSFTSSYKGKNIINSKLNGENIIKDSNVYNSDISAVNFQASNAFVGDINGSERNTIIQGGKGAIYNSLIARSLWVMPYYTWHFDGNYYGTYAQSTIDDNTVVLDSYLEHYFYIGGDVGFGGPQVKNSEIRGNKFYYNNITKDFYIMSIERESKINDSFVKGNLQIYNSNIINAYINSLSNKFRSHITHTSFMGAIGAENNACFAEVRYPFSGGMCNQQYIRNEEGDIALMSIEYDEYSSEPGDGHYADGDIPQGGQLP